MMTQQRHAIQRHSINAWQGKKCYFSMPKPEMKMSLQLFRQHIMQKNFLPQQHLCLPIMCCCTIIYTIKNCVNWNKFSIWITDAHTLLELVKWLYFRKFYTKTKLFLPPLVLLCLNHSQHYMHCVSMYQHWVKPKIVWWKVSQYSRNP